MNQNNREHLMTATPVPGLIWKMALPTIVAFLITSIYGLTDTFFVSSLGTEATAAVSVNSALDQLIMMAGSMMAVGAASYAARLLGARETERASQVLSTSFFTAFFFGLVVEILGITFMGPLVELLGAQPDSRQFAIDYATYVLLVAPLMASNFVMNQCLRAEGSAIFSMFGMGIGGVVNIVLDPILIRGYFGLPAMGVMGASLATALSKLISFLILLFPYLTRRSLLHLSIRNFRLEWHLYAQVISIGSSSMLRSGLGVLSGLLLNNIAGGISTPLQAAVGVTNRVMMFPFSVILGFGTGFQPVAGFNWGAKRFDRVRESYRYAARVSLIGGAIMGLAIAVGADWVISLFSETDAALLAYGALCIRIQCLAMPIHSWVSIVNMYCAGLGRAKGALALSTSRQGTCFIPLLFPLAALFREMGVVAVQGVADILSLALAIPILRRVERDVNAAEAAHSSAVGS